MYADVCFDVAALKTREDKQIGVARCPPGEADSPAATSWIDPDAMEPHDVGWPGVAPGGHPDRLDLDIVGR
jgi:hypothetical protein